jgi:hypothetical protein
LHSQLEPPSPTLPEGFPSGKSYLTLFHHPGIFQTANISASNLIAGTEIRGELAIRSGLSTNFAIH